MVSRIYLIRHGITEGNEKKWFYGHADIPLAERGRKALVEQREKGIYPELADADFYTTGLLRTEETLEILFGSREHEVISNLKELGFGEYECKTYDELKEYENFELWAWDESGTIKLPGGESRNEFKERVGLGIKELINLHRMKEWSHRHSGKDAISVCVCHGGVISSAMQQLFPDVKGSMWDWMPEPGYGYMIEIEEGEPAMYEKIAEVKKLGFGLMRLPVLEGGEIDIEQTKKMVDMFMEKGYTYFDTAWGYSDGASEAAIKVALVDRYPRDSFKLATKLPAWVAKTEEEAKAMFETSLKRCGVDYFDYYLFHNLGNERTQPFDDFHIWDFLAKKKEEGKIVNLGFSMHDKAAALEEVLNAHPDMDFVQLQINYADWESATVEARKCYEVARAHYKPVIIMEPVRGGGLANPPEQVASILKAANPNVSLASWALRFTTHLEGVLTVLSGMSSVEQMQDNLDTMDTLGVFTDEEKAALDEASRVLASLPQIPCTACRYCVKDCPSQINIPGVFRGLNNNSIYGDFNGAKGNYEWETRNGGKASACIECGQCEAACPQYIKIMEEMKKAAQLFE